MASDTADAPRRPGVPPKGRRSQIVIRFPQEHLELYRLRAAEAGLCVSDYVAQQLGRAHDLPDPDYLGVWERRYRPRRAS